MTSVFKKFLGRFNAAERERQNEKIFVGAFGKHPGWDDHIDDIGLETNLLIAAKRKLYVHGIGGNVDSGRWDRLTGDQLIEQFNREIFWYIDGRLIVGRMWSSQDGKGRKSYPFIVCVECQKLPTQWILDNVLQQLKKIETTCTSTNSASDVLAVIEKVRQKLRQLAIKCEVAQNMTVVYPDALSKLAERLDIGLGREGLFRILYHIDREVGRLRPGIAQGKALGSTLLRVPTCPNSILEDVLLWSSFLLAEFGMSTSILALAPPTDNGWIDVIIGEPSESQLYCLRASTKVIPLTSSIPYKMNSEFIEQANRLIHDHHGTAHGL